MQIVIICLTILVMAQSVLWDSFEIWRYRLRSQYVVGLWLGVVATSFVCLYAISAWRDLQEKESCGFGFVVRVLSHLLSLLVLGFVAVLTWRFVAFS